MRLEPSYTQVWPVAPRLVGPYCNYSSCIRKVAADGSWRPKALAYAITPKSVECIVSPAFNANRGPETLFKMQNRAILYRMSDERMNSSLSNAILCKFRAMWQFLEEPLDQVAGTSCFTRKWHTSGGKRGVKLEIRAITWRLPELNCRFTKKLYQPTRNNLSRKEVIFCRVTQQVISLDQSQN